MGAVFDKEDYTSEIFHYYDLLKQLACPLCKKTSMPPIYMCRNGHHVCAKCQRWQTECGMCHTPGKPNVRCKYLEKIAEDMEFPCANVLNDCYVALNAVDMVRHSWECEHVKYKCLVCRQWKGRACELMVHVDKHHEDNLVYLFSGAAEIVAPRSNFNRSYKMLIFYDYSLFWLTFQRTSTDREFSCTMRLISYSETEVFKYSYSLVFRSLAQDLKVTYQSDVLHLTEQGSADHTKFSIPVGILDSYGDDRLVFSLSIFNAAKPPARRPAWQHKYFWITVGVLVSAVIVWKKDSIFKQADAFEENFFETFGFL